MNFYQKQIARIQENCFPEDYIFQRIIKAKKFVDANYAGEICLDEIAKQGNFSKFHFIRVFKTIYGRTPHQYLIGVRIENARKMLRMQIPVTEVCFAVGFDSVSSFTNLFKKMSGVAPSVYRSKFAARQPKKSFLKPQF